MTENKQSRFAFTLFDYTLSDIKRICVSDYKYVVIGYETCPTTKKKHIQGFINLRSRIRFKAAKTLLGERAHIERARGSDSDNRKYCTKGGDYIEDGSPQQQGQRNDLANCAQAIAKGFSLKRVAEEFPTQYIRYERGIRAYRDIICPPPERSTKTIVSVCVGKPGTGKSHFCREQTLKSGEETYYKPRGDWWDGYRQQPNVVIDDFYGWIKYDELLKICDKYPYRVPVKGSFEVFNSTRIYITSNSYVSDWYKFEGFEQDAILRRLNDYLYFYFDENKQRQHTKIDALINY